jgi:hypothetical protein
MLEGSTGRTSPGWKNKLLCLRSGIKQLDMIPFKASVSNSIWRPFMCVNIIMTDQTYLTQVLLKSKNKKSVLRTKWGMCSVVHQRKNLHNQVQYWIHQSFFAKKKRKEKNNTLVLVRLLRFTSEGLAQSIQLEELTSCQNLVKQWQQFPLSTGSLVLTWAVSPEQIRLLRSHLEYHHW